MKVVEDLNSQLSLFECHDLDSLKSCQLMDRVDTKYMLPLNLVPDLLNAIMPFGSVLEVEGGRSSKYENIYFDDEHLQFYRDHHDGKLNRHKVRRRTYSGQSLSFLEVKFKNNKGRTIKSRVVAEHSSDYCLDNYKPFLEAAGVETVSALKAVQHCHYWRLAFASRNKTERLTVDLDLSYQSTEKNSGVSLPEIVIVELKQQQENRFSDFYQAIVKFGFRPANFSKYCIGMTLLHPGQLKANQFKRTIIEVNKLRKWQHVNGRS